MLTRWPLRTDSHHIRPRVIGAKCDGPRGRKRYCISFYDHNERKQLQDIEGSINQPLTIGGGGYSRSLRPMTMKEQNGMDLYQYHVGQTVRFIMVSRNSGIGGLPAGDFQVVGLLPNYQGNNQYRVQSNNDGHQRVVIESEIILQ